MPYYRTLDVYLLLSCRLQVSEIPTLEDGSTDYTQDFFGKPAFLTVSGQVSLFAGHAVCSLRYCLLLVSAYVLAGV